MDFERYYDKLPDFIKFNSYILNFFLKIPKLLRNNNDSYINSQNQLLNLLFTHCNIEIKGDLRNVQLLYVELLKFVDNVCNKYDINYWLGFGTLLGAVRHGGFIPWDDDIDLAILREDYNKLIEVLPKEINRFPEFKKKCGLTLFLENGDDYFKDFNGIYDIDNKNNILHEDTFHYLQLAWLKPYVKIDFFPLDFILDEKVNSISKKFLSQKYKFNKDVNYGKVNFFEELESKRKEVGFTDSKTKYFSDSFDAVQLAPIRIFEYENTFPLKTIYFEGYEFKCPKNYDHHLKVSFGEDYMSIPKIIENHNLLPFIKSQFKSNEEKDEIFKECISYLKKINKSY